MHQTHAHAGARARASRDASFRRYRLGQWVQDDNAWMPRPAWDACSAAREIPQCAEVILGFDGSFNGDATALVVCTIGDLPLLSRPPSATSAPPSPRHSRR